MTVSIPRGPSAHATWRAITAIIAAVAAVAGSFAYAGRTPAFIGHPASTFVTDRMPAAVVNATLERLGSLAQPASLALALVLATGVLAAAVLACLECEVRLERRYLGTALTFGAVWLVAAATTGAAVASLAAAVPAAAVVGAVEFAAVHDPLSVRQDRTVDRRKRATLQAGFGVLSFAGIAALVGRWRTPDSSMPYLGDEDVPSEEAALLEDAETAAFELPDAPGLVSEIGSFYTVDINAIDPVVERDDWALSVTGAVDDELSIDYDGLREREADRFYSTLRCVGEGLNDREMDTAVWTGVPVADLLEDAGAGDVDYAVAHAVDGFWNTIAREALERSYLVYGMNGRLLPREHGHPVRLLVPGNWGEVNVKWIDEIELTDEDRDGYWQERGWDGTGEVETVAKLWSVDRGDGTVTVGGHAYAGRRGVDRVEVSTDGGDRWTEAALSPELEGDAADVRDVWRQWRYTFEPTADEHEVVVRAIDGTGAIQTAEPSGSRPDGATGWVSRTIEA